MIRKNSLLNFNESMKVEMKIMELTYTKVGDYLLPNLTLPENQPIGKYGLLRLKYIKSHKRGLYTQLMLTGKLNSHLHAIDTIAKNRIDTYMKQVENSAPNKATHQMEWVGYMNNAKASYEEIIYQELIYN